MRRPILFLLILTLLCTAAFAQDNPTCEGAPPSRLVIGGQGRATPGPATNLRATPSTRGTFVGQVSEGQIFDVLDGPVCADGYAWWQITFDGLVGWTAEGLPREYWLEPYPPPEPTPTPSLIPGVLPTFSAPPSPTPPTLADSENVIAYVTTAPGASITTLFVMNPDGSNPRQLLNRYADHPLWSPNGRWIVFGGNGLTILHVATGAWVELMQGEQYFPNPQWSPDSQRILVTTRTQNNLEIQMVHVVSGAYNNITANPADDYDPDWSPDGRSIVFISERHGQPDVYRMDIDGSDVVRLTEAGMATNPVYSPDGSQIAWSSGDSIHIMDADGGNARWLTEGIMPIWSPDGQKIVYKVYDLNTREYNLEIVDVSGENRIRLLPQPLLTPHVSWSPDGTQLLVEGQGAAFYTININGGEPVIIGRGVEFPAPDWRPVITR
jgi:Tol biopolymer transport system component